MRPNPPPLVIGYTNTILSNLPADSLQRLRLRRIALPPNHAIEFPGRSIDSIVFLESGVASMTTTFDDGSQVEVGMFGFESMLGVSALMGARRSLNRIYMQLAGSGYIAPLSAARDEFLRAGDFQRLALRCVQAQLSQAAQSAGCNARHDVQQRLARWLLLCADCLGSTDLFISQEFVATMLGVRRMSANLAIGHFKDLGLIDHHRSEIQILNAKGLEERACECYRVLRHHLDDSAEFDRGFPERQAIRSV